MIARVTADERGATAQRGWYRALEAVLGEVQHAQLLQQRKRGRHDAVERVPAQVQLLKLHAQEVKVKGLPAANAVVVATREVKPEVKQEREAKAAAKSEAAEEAEFAAAQTALLDAKRAFERAKRAMQQLQPKVGGKKIGFSLDEVHASDFWGGLDCVEGDDADERWVARCAQREHRRL